MVVGFLTVKRCVEPSLVATGCRLTRADGATEPWTGGGCAGRRPVRGFESIATVVDGGRGCCLAEADGEDADEAGGARRDRVRAVCGDLDHVPTPFVIVRRFVFDRSEHRPHRARIAGVSVEVVIRS